MKKTLDDEGKIFCPETKRRCDVWGKDGRFFCPDCQEPLTNNLNHI